MVRFDSANFSEAKRIILAIIQLSGGRLEGRTRLYKAFYAAHLHYWNKYGKYLTTHPIVWMPQGPGIDRGSDILNELVSGGQLEFTEQTKGMYTEGVYSTGVETPQIEVTREEQEAISEAVAWATAKTGTALSDECHIFSRTWKEAEERRDAGAELHIYLDSLSEESLERKRALSREAGAILDAFLPRRDCPFQATRT